jgi:hypothetical protein
MYGDDRPDAKTGGSTESVDEAAIDRVYRRYRQLVTIEGHRNHFELASQCPGQPPDVALDVGFVNRTDQRRAGLLRHPACESTLVEQAEIDDRLRQPLAAHLRVFLSHGDLRRRDEVALDEELFQGRGSHNAVIVPVALAERPTLGLNPRMQKSRIAVLLLAVACAREESPPPAPTATQAPVVQWTRQELGGALNTDSTKAASQATMALASDGMPLIAFREVSDIHVKRWTGSAWQQVGGALDHYPNQNSRHPTVIARSDGSLVCTWIEMNGAFEEAHAAAWNGTAWSPLGARLTTVETVHARATDTPNGLVVVTLERIGNQTQLFARRWSGSTWQQLGGGPLSVVLGATILDTPAITTLPDGSPVVAWIEQVSGSGTTLNLTRWGWTANEWTPMTSPGGVDSDSRIALSTNGRGQLVLSRSWNAGLRPYAVHDGTQWNEIGRPDPKMEAGGSIHTVIARGPANTPSFATLAWYQGALQLSWWDGAKWTIIAPSVNPEAHKAWDPALTVAADGTMYAAWTDTRKEPSKIFVARYKK